ncbi:hypothetical protein [Anaerosolibacter sp.]|uniref:hypothetical protein n=1 Tax=Anaerosolibacter sp. TaxID=1872527 RepID=UPI0039EF377E
MKEVYHFKHYIVLDNGKELIISNRHGNYENHSHFWRRCKKNGRINLEAVKTCIKLCDQKKIPRSDYMVTACARLTTDSDYKNTLLRISQQRAAKEKYFNVNKGRV